MKRPVRILLIANIVLLCSFFIFATKNSLTTTLVPTESEDTLKSTVKNVSEFYQIKAVKIPSNLNFAGERLPIEKPDVKERIDRELLVNTYWQSNTLLLFKRAHKYFPIIEPILQKNGIPDDFKYLALIESGLQNVTSHAGARGFWQIMKATGKENGLEINDNVDERYHLEKSTEVACKYLNQAYLKFGNWTLAAASYNAGQAGIARRLKAQMVNDYYDLLLVEETARYMLRVIAVKEIISHPKRYGFEFDLEDLYNISKTKTVGVSSSISNMALFAKKLGTNYKELRLLNPWILQNKLNNASKKKYYLSIPE
ncbi:MAG: lytic transglycosylase domain-containing protein [Flavobacteriaceae bacterium]|nr:lytic transglycosylase domain-containing protein [Flavobacteriaceae bacterium]